MVMGSHCVAPPCRHRTHACAHLPERSVLHSDGQVARQIKFVAAADHNAVDARDHRLAGVANGVQRFLEASLLYFQ